ncbi:MAG: transcription antitermination factor NusB [Acidimicrobiales bacterium]
MSGADPRQLAADLLRRIDVDGAYANLAVPAALARSTLAPRDRAFVTELVYGATRMRRACDFLVDRFLLRRVEPDVRAVLRLGAYQLQFLGVPAHAAVAATVSVAPARARGLVNAVLRRVASTPPTWPDDATRLSYPDWIVERVVADLGAAEAHASLERMNEAPRVTERADGYVQDLASQWVVDLVGAAPGVMVADLCAAPGGKATGLAGAGARVVAADVHPGRTRLMADNVRRLTLDESVLVVTSDGRFPPFRPAPFDRVLIDAPCSGLGTLRRRPDARWRIDREAVDRLAVLQRHLVEAAVPLVRPGGVLVYSVCTLTRDESIAIDEHLAARRPELRPLDSPPEPWRPWGRGALLLPHTADTDGMALFRYATAH